MEELSFSDQIRLMRGTKFVVGMHGAGLTNMLFMESGSTVLEIFDPKGYFNPCFFRLACDLGHQYYYCFGHGDGKESNIYVDVDQLEHTIKKILTP